MKKLIAIAAITTIALPLFAQEEASKEAAPAQQQKTERKDQSAVWPAYFALAQWPRAVDVVGVRLTIPFSTSQENVTGVDIGFWGKSLYFEGVQLNILRNNVVDGAAGFQVGLYNSIGRGEMLGAQVGLWNEALSIRGVQAGLVNVAGEAQGLQFGLINRAETMHGYQIGIINVIRDAELQFMPIVNIGF